MRSKDILLSLQIYRGITVLNNQVGFILPCFTCQICNIFKTCQKIGKFIFIRTDAFINMWKRSLRFLGHCDGYHSPSCVQFLNPLFPSMCSCKKIKYFCRCILLLEDHTTFYAVYFIMSHTRPVRGALANLLHLRSGWMEMQPCPTSCHEPAALPDVSCCNYWFLCLKWPWTFKYEKGRWNVGSFRVRQFIRT